MPHTFNRAQIVGFYCVGNKATPQRFAAQDLTIEAADARSRARNGLLRVGFDARTLLVGLGETPIGFSYDLAIGKARLCFCFGIFRVWHA